MNRFLTGITDICSSHLTDEKILIVPSLSVGRQILERLALEGHPWVNLRAETVRTLATEVAGSDFASQGKKLLSRAQSLALIEQTCGIALGEDSYFGELRDRAGLHRAMQQTIQDLRTSGVSLDRISNEVLESEQKAIEIRAVADVYEQALNDGGYVDGSDVLRLALAKVESGKGPYSNKSWYLVPDGLDAVGIEHEFLMAIAGNRLQTIATDDRATWASSLTSIENRHALGEENEIRSVLRTILSENLPLDDAEIIYTDTATYVPLIIELAAEYDVPCTFAQGIPVTFSRPGQAAIGLLDWLAGNYDANVLRKFVAEGCIDLHSATEGSDPPGALAASRVIRKARIGWGRDRHLICIDRLIADLERKLAREDSERGEVGDSSLQERLENARAVRVFVQRLVEFSDVITDADSVDCAAFARVLLDYLSQFASVTTELDGLALKALQSMLGELTELPQLHATSAQAVERLREAVTQTYVNPSTPRPANLHVSDYKSGGYSGRTHTYVVGLDESRFPGNETQDPVLLDSERLSINDTISPSQLPLLGDRPVENTDALRACLARLRGSVVLSFSCRNLLEDREQFPSSIILEAFRISSGQPDADYSRLLESLPEPAGFVPSDRHFLDETEWWLARLSEIGQSGDDIANAVRSVYPWLECGHRAETVRNGSEFSVFDGMIGLESSDGIGAFSASRLEALAKCPFAYFVRHVLDIAPVEDRKLDPTRWLDGLEYGTLLHDVFRQFMERITSRGEKPSIEHVDEITQIARLHIDKQAELVPPPNAAAFKTQCDDIIRTCLIFLKMEQEHCKRAEPRFFEVPFGSTWSGVNSGIGDSQPITVKLDNGGTFTLTGRIDRIDEDADGDYQVWDYKTGGTWGFKEESSFDRGRQLQHALYAVAVNELLCRAGIDGRVSQSGYFFPALKGEGLRIVKLVDADGLKVILGHLHEILSGGLFLSTDDASMCTYCDISPACGGSQAVARSKAKLQSDPSTLLNPIRRLLDDAQ